MKKHILLVMAVSLLTFGLFTSCEDGGWDGLAFERGAAPNKPSVTPYSTTGSGTGGVLVRWTVNGQTGSCEVFIRRDGTENRTVESLGQGTVRMYAYDNNGTIAADPLTIINYNEWHLRVTDVALKAIIENEKNGDSYQFGVASMVPGPSSNSVRSDIVWSDAIVINFIP